MNNQLISCINLSRLLPIKKLEQNIYAISSLVYNNDEILDNFLQKVDQPLLIHPEGFLCCEYNRDGDSYRKPGTKEYFPPIKGTVPSDELLELEEELNKLFKEYVKLYYEPIKGSKGDRDTKVKHSVYCYKITESNNDEFIVAILIKSIIKNEMNNTETGQWESANLFKIKTKDYVSNYDLTTSINIYMNGKTKETDSDFHLSGSVVKRLKQDINGDSSDFIKFHSINIGQMVEKMETEMIKEIEGIYFNKTRQIISEQRASENLLNDTGTIFDKYKHK